MTQEAGKRLRFKWLLISLSLLTCSDSRNLEPHPETQPAKTLRVRVLISLDEEGRVLDASADSGESDLRQLAVAAARAKNYEAPCDLNGSRIPSTPVVMVYFNHNREVVDIQEPIRVGSLVSGRRIKHAHPKLPTGLAGGERQIVIVRLWVDAAGQVNRARGVRGPAELHKYAVEAALQWKYKPTYLNCRPVPVTVTGVVVFEGSKQRTKAARHPVPPRPRIRPGPPTRQNFEHRMESGFRGGPATG